MTKEPTSGKSSAAMELVQEALDAGEEVFLVDLKGGEQNAGWARMLPGGEPYRPYDLDDRTATRLAMEGAQGDLAPAEWGAVARGVSIPIVRRLSPAVAGDTMDRLRTQLEQIRDRAVEMMPDGVDRDAVAGDVSARGYRLAVHEARGAAKSEQVRLVLFHLQLALCRAAEGREGAAMISIRRANGVLSNA